MIAKKDTRNILPCLTFPIYSLCHDYFLKVVLLNEGHVVHPQGYSRTQAELNEDRQLIFTSAKQNKHHVQYRIFE
jgi:hypothetical protein